MRLKMISTVIWVLLLSQVASRPQQTEPERATSQVTKHPDEDARSRLDPPNDRELKDYQYMDQSLRTVATQLLNVSGSKENADTEDGKNQSKLGLLIRKPDRIIPPAQEAIIDNQKNNMELMKGITVDVSTVGRPINSKYNYFEVSHPGQAMAMTEEDLEREASVTRFTTGHKSHPTTTGGLSTWILLNPPSTTTKYPTESDKIEEPIPTKTPSLPLSTYTEKVGTTQLETTPPMQKLPPSQKTTTKPANLKKTTIKSEKITSPSLAVTTARSEALSTLPIQSSTLPPMKINEETIIKTTTKRITSTNRSTIKPKSTTPRPTTIISKITTMKVKKTNQTRSSKPSVIRKSTTAKPEVETLVNSTSKIEKVTFKSVQMITTPKSHVESVQKPTFSAKIQASMKTDSKLIPSSSSSSSKPNNVLKLYLKKPVDSPTTIEIDPIQVNAPVLTIEKLNDPEESNENDGINSSESITLPNSHIDVKFDFNPELTKLETSTEVETTKRPKTSSKRKKHKTRRRKPSSTTTPSPSSSSSSIISPKPSTMAEELEETSGLSAIPDTSIQESKIVPDSNNTKHKKKQVAKPITTQIYNFISREVMPSVGVMSLVGLGLGLASYFLYPFGGAIARRNYQIEPNYKYNLDEYGGNYGQSEEEVFTKVLQGMNTDDAKYGGMKNFENNHHRYQMYDGAYTDTHITRKPDPRFPTSPVPIYRPGSDKKPLPYDLKYRNTGFKYSDGPTTPIQLHYQRPKGSDFAQANVDRQFVVGNIPKEYSNDKKNNPLISTTSEASEIDFEKQIAQNLQFKHNQQSVNPNYDQTEAEPLKSENYEDIEITPDAVAVEHGPRSLKLEELIVNKRMKRDSVIQLIPSREEMEKEEPLNNEILNIIDSLPEDMIHMKEVKKKPELSTGTTDGYKTKETELKESSNNTLIITMHSASSSPPSTSTKSEIFDSSSPGTEHDVETSFPTNNATPEAGFNIFNFVRRVAEIKFRLGLTILKHASESFARYLGHVQKRINGDE